MINTRHAVWIVLLSVGCATPMTAIREDNRRLSLSVAELRADRRARDRKIRDLEHQLALAKEKAVSTEPLPVLPVEVMAPPVVSDGQRLVGVADDGTEIVYEGDAALGRSGVIDIAPARRAAPRAEPTERSEATRRPPAVSARTTRAPTRSDVVSSAADGDYRAAVDLVKAGKHGEAVEALRGFLHNYPRHEYADNAQYWLGETFYAQKDYEHALAEFRATIETYPRGNKVPDALLKVGYCYQALGKTDKARAVLEQVVNLYPKTEPAALASKRLESP